MGLYPRAYYYFYSFAVPKIMPCQIDPTRAVTVPIIECWAMTHHSLVVDELASIT